MLYCTEHCDPQEFARSAITVSTLCCIVLNIVTAGVCLFSDEGVDTVLKVVAAGVCQVSDNGVDILLYCTEHCDCRSLPAQR